jgi:hypothetical protein
VNGGPGGNGAANTGKGGTAGSDVGGTGGSGIIGFKYPDSKPDMTIGAGLTGSTTSAGGFKVTLITQGTGTVTFN